MFRVFIPWRWRRYVRLNPRCRLPLTGYTKSQGQNHNRKPGIHYDGTQTVSHKKVPPPPKKKKSFTSDIVNRVDPQKCNASDQIINEIIPVLTGQPSLVGIHSDTFSGDQPCQNGTVFQRFRGLLIVPFWRGWTPENILLYLVAAKASNPQSFSRWFNINKPSVSTFYRKM
jgi:hypothetical protein